MAEDAANAIERYRQQLRAIIIAGNRTTWAIIDSGAHPHDSAGHPRPVYRPLMLYERLFAREWGFATESEGDLFPRNGTGLSWLDDLESDLKQEEPSVYSAARGDLWAERIWHTLVLHAAADRFGREDWRLTAAAWFQHLIKHQQPSSAFLLATPADQPETLWYHELQILHAVANYAAMSGDRSAKESAFGAAEFHQAETQPDHATTQPWGLLAFIWNESTHPLADQLLHTVLLQQPGAIDGVSLMLLADCLYCLRLLDA